MADLTVKEAQEKVEKFLKERNWFPSDRNGKYYTLGHAMEEMGEVARCITLLESRRCEVLDKDCNEVLLNLKKELGDLMYHVFKIALAYGIDMEDAFEHMMKKNTEKFPAEKFKDFKQH